MYWSFDVDWSVSRDGVDSSLCDSNFTIFGDAYTGDCTDCTFAFELFDGSATPADAAHCNLPRWMNFNLDTISDRVLKHYDIREYSGYFSYSYTNVLMVDYVYTVSYEEYDAVIEESLPVNALVYGMAEDEPTGMFYDASLSVSETGFEWSGIHDDDPTVALPCGFETKGTGELPCDDETELKDVWSFTVGADDVGTEIAIEIDTVAADTAFDPEVEVVYVSGSTCTVWSSDDDFICSFPPPDYECPSIVFTPESAGVYLMGVEVVGSCAGATGEYAIASDSIGSFTVAEDDSETVLTVSGCDYGINEQACVVDSSVYSIESSSTF